jgi:hypothetical protein
MKERQYVSADGSERINESTARKMAEDAEQYGWTFEFSNDRSTLVITWDTEIGPITYTLKAWDES